MSSDCEQNSEPFPNEWSVLIEQQFSGKSFGLRDFDANFKQALLVQIARANVALQQAFKKAGRARNKFKLDDFNQIIDECDVTGTPSVTRGYIQPIIIASAVETVGRCYLKALQTQGQMMGASYQTFTEALENAKLPQIETLPELEIEGLEQLQSESETLPLPVAISSVVS